MRPSASSPRGLGEPPLRRLPILMRVLAVLSLIAGLWGSVSSLAELLGGLRADRTAFISRVHDRQLALYDKLQATKPAAGRAASGRALIEPLLRLPRSDFEKLSLQLGGQLYDQLPVAIPLALLQLLLSWLLLTGSLGVLRRQGWALSMWSWACMVNIPFSLLSIIVTLVHSRTLREQLGPQVAAALAQQSGRSVEAELYTVHELVRLYVGGQAALLALWVLLLGGTALYLQRPVARWQASKGRDLP
jgi:hypothetical protein